MRLRLIVLTAAIAVAACSSPPLPTASPIPPLPTASPIPTASPVASPTPSPTTSIITEQVGLLTVTHPAAWRVVPGPTAVAVANRPLPLFYLSDVPLTVGPCPTPDSTTGDEFQGCPEPLCALPRGAVLVTVTPNLGLPALNPPEVGVGAADGPCRALGGATQISSVVGGVVVTACLRGPDIAAHEAEVRGIIASLKTRFLIVRVSRKWFRLSEINSKRPSSARK